jgi:hypothetical protein
MTTDLDGTPIDLDRALIALDGSRWLWTFEHTESGEPLMLRIDTHGAAILPLPVVYRDHGPVIADRQPITAAMYRQVLEAV